MPNQKPSIQKQTHLVENINKGEIPFMNKTELEAGKRVIFVCALDPNSITCKTSHTATQVLTSPAFAHSSTREWRLGSSANCIALQGGELFLGSSSSSDRLNKEASILHILNNGPHCRRSATSALSRQSPTLSGQRSSGYS
jgi:hypothetical protein